MPRIAARELVMQRVMDAMSRVPIVSSVERNRRSAPEAEDCPLLIVFDGGHTAELADTLDTAYEMQVGIDGAVTADTDEGLGPAANELYACVIEEIMRDPTLGGATTQIREDGLEFRLSIVQESEVPLASFSLNVTAEFRTDDGQPFVGQTFADL